MFISPSLLIAIFTGYRWKFGWQFFSFSSLRMLRVSSWSLRFMVRNLLSFKMFSGYFQIFSLPLVFSSLTMMSLGLHFFGFTLFGGCWASIKYRLSFVKWEMLPTFIFEIFMTQMVDSLVVSRSLRLVFCFFFLIFSSVQNGCVLFTASWARTKGLLSELSLSLLQCLRPGLRLPWVLAERDQKTHRRLTTGSAVLQMLAFFSSLPDTIYFSESLHSCFMGSLQILWLYLVRETGSRVLTACYPEVPILFLWLIFKYTPF